MTIQVKYTPSVCLPLWKINLMELKQSVWKWRQIDDL